MQRINLEIITDRNWENKTPVFFSFQVNLDMTLEQLFQRVRRTGYSIVEKSGYITPSYQFHSSHEVVKYMLRNGKYEWQIPLDEVTVKEFVETFHLDSINFFIFRGEFGACWFEGIEWETIIEILKGGFEMISIMVTLKEGYSLMKDGKVSIKNIIKKFHNSEKEIKFNYVEEAILNQDVWALSDFMFKFDLDELTAKLLLDIAGYIYKEENDLYFFNKSLHEKNIKEFYKLCEEHISKINDKQ